MFEPTSPVHTSPGGETGARAVHARCTRSAPPKTAYPSSTSRHECCGSKPTSFLALALE